MLFNSRHILVCAIMAMGLTACGEKETAAAPEKSVSAPVSVASASAAQNTTPSATYKIRVSNEPYPPFNIFNADRSFSGLEIEVLAAIAKDQNFKIEYEPFLWSQIFNDLKEKQISMVVGGLAKDDIDGNVMTVTVPYMRAPDCLVAKTDADLEQWNKNTLALVENDENDEDVINNHGVSPKNITQVRSQYQGLKQVLDGHVKSTMSDCYVLRYTMKQSFPNAQFVVKELPIADADVEGYDLVFGVRQDETELLQKLNQGIANIKQSGELDKILQKWQ